MRTLYFHIGYPKAASTFLQKNVFKNQKNINFINDNNWEDLLKFSQFLFWSKNEEFKKGLSDYINFLKNLDEDRINVISHEGFTNFSSNSKFDINEIFERLKYVSEKCNLKYKFIFVIRKQAEYIKSRYAQGHGLTGFYSVNKKFLKFAELKKYFLKQNRTKSELVTFESFNYFKTYMNLKNLFKEDPKILLFEDLQNSPKIFIEDLLIYMNLKEKILLENIDLSVKNIGKKSTTGEYFRKKDIFNTPYKGSLNRVASFVPTKKLFFKFFSRSFKDRIKILSYRLDRILSRDDKIILSDFDELKIKEYYKDGNNQLSKLMKRDLSQLGY